MFFRQLVARANEWLRKNTGVHVRVCETITWLSHDAQRLEESEQMFMSKKITPNSTTYFCRGLRLWMVPRTVRKVETISYRDFVPDKPTDNVQSLVNKANKKFSNASFKGHIITIETVGVPILGRGPGWTGSIDSGVTQWKESVDVDSPYAFILRVFHTKDARSARVYSHDGAQLGTKDMVPRQKDGSYEGFEELIDRANNWLKDHSDIVVTNMQSLTVQQNSGNERHCETGSACYYSMPGINNDSPTEFFRILRVAYVKPLGTLVCDLPIVYPFTYQTIAPELLRSKDSPLGAGVGGGGGGGGGIGGGGGGGGQLNEACRMERMKETFSRGLTALRTSGSELICAETVVNPMQLYTDDTAQELQQHDEISFLLTIRLFLTNQITAGDMDGRRSSADRNSPTQSSLAQTSGGNDNHPGPIFLRNVVTRRYKYRWLAVAIFAVTCMTVIVVLSVVYSNR